MDSMAISLGDYLDNFDPNAFLTLSDDETENSAKSGMKSQLGEDPMKACSFSEDSVFLHSENMSGSSLYRPTVPSTSEMAGNYSFQIKLGAQVRLNEWLIPTGFIKMTNSTSSPRPPVPLSSQFYVYSEIWPSWPPSIPPSCKIRVTPVFKDQAYIREIVRCCPNHSVIDSTTNDYSVVAHFIRCDNQKVTYEECHMTGRFFLTIPFIASQQDPKTKNLSTHELFSFICNNSCGGLNRRAIQVIFELLQGQTVIGRRIVEVRVCACPGRDSNIDESQKQAFRRKRRCQSADQPPFLVQRGEPPYQAPPRVDVSVDECPPARKKRTGENFYLKINGRQNYVIMERIAKALELFTSMEKRFFSKNFPFQALDQMSKSQQNESPEYVEPDSTLYRRNSCQTNSVNNHSPLPSPTTTSRWPDSTYSHGNHSNSSSHVPYSSRSVA